MILFLFFIFTVIPVTELYLLFKASNYIGGVSTFLVIILTGIWGSFFARNQGRQILLRLQQKTNRGEAPTEDILHGLLVFLGGVFLVTPGFLTDILGFSFIFPVSRLIYIHFLQNYFAKKINRGEAFFYSNINFHSTNLNHRSQNGGPRDVTPPDSLKDVNDPTHGPE